MILWVVRSAVFVGIGSFVNVVDTILSTTFMSARRDRSASA